MKIQNAIRPEDQTKELVKMDFENIGENSANHIRREYFRFQTTIRIIHITYYSVHNWVLLFFTPLGPILFVPFFFFHSIRFGCERKQKKR